MVQARDGRLLLVVVAIVVVSSLAVGFSSGVSATWFWDLGSGEDRLLGSPEIGGGGGDPSDMVR